MKQIKAYHYARALYRLTAESSAAEAEKYTNNLIRLLKARNETYLLPRILEKLQEAQRHPFDAKPVTVASPQKLEEKEKDALQELLPSALNAKRISLQEQIAEDLIGGVVLYWDDYRWDASIKGALNKMNV